MFARRLALLGGVLTAGVAVLGSRLVWLQLLQGARYTAVSQAVLELPGEWVQTVRGRILDCRGRALAADRPSFDVCVDYRLTRLYDPRYQRFQQLQAQEPASGGAVSEPAAFEVQRAKADLLLRDVAEICPAPREQLLERIDQINQRIYVLTALQVLRKHYQAREQPFPHGPGASAQTILADFEAQIPSEPERLRRLNDPAHAVLETDQGQVLLENVSEDAALMVEERLVGDWPQPHRSKPARVVRIETGQVRQYPWGRTACHLVGQMMPAAAETAGVPEGESPTIEQLQEYRPGDRRGEWGAERLFERRLRGRRGWERYDRQGRLLEAIAPELGPDVRLTIDADLHDRIEQVFEGANDQGRAYLGAAVVIEVAAGAVRAAVSAPTFDLNHYYEPQTFQVLNEVAGRNDPLKRKWNRALSVNYEPGSTVKPSLLLGALEQGAAVTDFLCQPSYLDIMPRSVCRQVGHGAVDSRRALKESCSFYFIELGARLGSERVAGSLSAAGFGRRVLSWPSEAPEEQIFRAFRETAGHLGRDAAASARDRAYMCTGLAVVDGSIVQMANSMATLARGGTWVSPCLVEEPRPVPQSHRLGTAANVAVVEEGLWAVVNEVGGTAHEVFRSLEWANHEVTAYGKTGSTTNFSVFAGYARSRDGRCVAVGLVVEDAGGGGRVAAPIAREIFRACGELGYLPAAEKP